MKRLLCLVLLSLSLQFFPAAPAQAALCDLYGGTTYRGCVYPKILWHDGYNNYFESKVSAAHSNHSMQQQNYGSSGINAGVQLGPVSYQDKDWGGCGYTQRTDDTFMHPTQAIQGDYNNPYDNVPLHGWSQTTDQCGATYAKYHSSAAIKSIDVRALCPPGYTIVRDSTVFTREAPFGWACRPTIALENMKASRPCSECDFDLPGHAYIGNPVALPSRQKSEFRQDIRTAGPYPIVWSRTFAGEDNREWDFAHIKFAQFTTAAGQDFLTFRRGDGSHILFKSTGSPRNWVSDMSASLSPSLQSRAFDILDSNGDLIGFELRTRPGIVETYAPNGKLLSTTNPQGHSHHYIYGLQGRLEKIEDDFGNFLQIGYVPGDNKFSKTSTLASNPWDNTGGGTVSFTGYSGSVFEPIYNIMSVSNGQATVSYQYQWESVYNHGYLMVGATDPLGNTEQYVYGETIDGSSQGKHWMTGVIGKDGRRHATYTYANSAVLVLRQWKHKGDGSTDDRTEGFHYSGHRFYDPNGNWTDMTHTWFQQVGGFSKPCKWCSGSIVAKTISYTGARPTTIVDFKNVSETRTYDARKMLATKTEASGTPLARTTQWSWHPDLALPAQVVEPITVNGVASTRTTTLVRNAQGRIEGVDVSAPGVVTRQTVNTYGPDGLLQSVTHPDGRVDQFTYHPNGEVASSTTAHGTSLARTTTFGGYDASGNPGWMIEPSGLATRMQWDAASQLTRIERGTPGTGGIEGAGGTWETIVIEYSPIGKVSAVQRPDGTRMEFTYNAAHRLIQVRSRGIDAALLGQIDYTLTPAGDVATATVSVSGQVIKSTSFAYDAYSRLEKEINAQGGVQDVDLDLEGNPVGNTDPMNHTTTRQVDALGRTISVVDEMMGQSTLAYDAQDNLVSATDARGVQTTYQYNAFNELTAVVSPDRGTFTITRDINGQATKVVDPRGVEANGVFDLLGRPVSTDFDAASVPAGTPGFVPGTRQSTWTWDTCTNGMGRLCQIVDWTGTTAYTYDLWGRMTAKSFVPVGHTAAITVGYGYDVFGRLAAMTYPSGKTLVFTRGNDGQVSGINWQSQTVVNQIGWRPFDNQPTGWQWSAPALASASVSMEYDQDGRLVAIDDIDRLALLRNPDGQLTGVSHLTTPDNDMVYAYDAGHRLTQADHAPWSGPMNYGYDGVANRTSKTQGTDGWQYAYGATSNRLTSITPVTAGVLGTPQTRVMDAMGNTITDDLGRQYGYDAAGRMATANTGSSILEYRVGVDGLRTGKTVTAPVPQEIFYAYDNQRRLLGVYAPDGQGSWTTVEELAYLPGTWRLLGTIRGQTGSADGTWYPVLTDAVGAARVVLDPVSGDPLWTWEGREAFGHAAPNQQPTANHGAFTFHARFPGQWFDPETGLHHNGFRDYDARTGRYVQSDPIGLEAGWNTYGYVGGDPVGAYDPLGLKVAYSAKSIAHGGPGYSGAISAKQSVHEMRRKSATFNMMMLDLEQSPETYIIRVSNPKLNRYDPDKNIVSWNTEMEISCGNPKRFFGPLSGLAHEIGHAYMDEQRRKNNKGIRIIRRFPEIEEYRDVLPIERKIHSEMGWPAGRSFLEYFNSEIVE